jgi:hypothetical protein
MRTFSPRSSARWRSSPFRLVRSTRRQEICRNLLPRVRLRPEQLREFRPDNLRRPLCRYSASCAQRKLLRTDASAIGGSRQRTVVERERSSDLRPGGRLSHDPETRAGTLTIRLDPFSYIAMRCATCCPCQHRQGCRSHEQTW